jgi:hypothetical protein
MLKLQLGSACSLRFDFYQKNVFLDCCWSCWLVIRSKIVICKLIRVFCHITAAIIKPTKLCLDPHFQSQDKKIFEKLIYSKPKYYVWYGLWRHMSQRMKTRYQIEILYVNFIFKQNIRFGIDEMFHNVRACFSRQGHYGNRVYSKSNILLENKINIYISIELMSVHDCFCFYFSLGFHISASLPRPRFQIVIRTCHDVMVCSMEHGVCRESEGSSQNMIPILKRTCFVHIGLFCDGRRLNRTNMRQKKASLEQMTVILFCKHVETSAWLGLFASIWLLSKKRLPGLLLILLVSY